MDNRKYLALLSEKYPTVQSVCTEIINLSARLSLPKGTEHFMSDLHGEYEAFCHILNNCSGVIREKVHLLYDDKLPAEEWSELLTVIYYPSEKLELLSDSRRLSREWYLKTLARLIELAKLLSSKYTRAQVRQSMPDGYSYIIDELLHAQDDEDSSLPAYHNAILNTIIDIDNAKEFIVALSTMIKTLAVDHLHIVGDIFDRGARPDSILDLLTHHHSVDIEWGNHDILWMGAVSGSEVCMAAVVRNSITYGNMAVLENGYGISLRPLMMYAEHLYPALTPEKASLLAISIIMFKLEGQLIKRHPEYHMNDRLHLDRINHTKGTVTIDGVEYALNDVSLAISDTENPYALSAAEGELVAALHRDFTESERLDRHIRFLYKNGSIYNCFNGNLLFHGCIPLNEDGSFYEMQLDGKAVSGRALMDGADAAARRAFFTRQPDSVDFMWFLWCGDESPLSGRRTKTFERMFCEDETTWTEPQNPYFAHYEKEETCKRILREFGLDETSGHIINGHTPVRVSKGESPVRANGRLIIIDGGFCRAYQKTTGIAGYTLIYNSHCMRLKSHQPFCSIEEALDSNKDIHSHSEVVEINPKRINIADSDSGKRISERISDLKQLLEFYRSGQSAG